MNTEKFVYYESFYNQIRRIESRLGKEAAYELQMAIVEYGLFGVLPEDDSDAWIYGLEQTIASINAAHDRYAAAVANGKKGGRPTIFSTEDILEKIDSGLSVADTARVIGCSEQTVRNKINSRKPKTVSADSERLQATYPLSFQHAVDAFKGNKKEATEWMVENEARFKHDWIASEGGI